MHFQMIVVFGILREWIDYILILNKYCEEEKINLHPFFIKFILLRVVSNLLKQKHKNMVTPT